MAERPNPMDVITECLPYGFCVTEMRMERNACCDRIDLHFAVRVDGKAWLAMLAGGMLSPRVDEERIQQRKADQIVYSRGIRIDELERELEATRKRLARVEQSALEYQSRAQRIEGQLAAKQELLDARTAQVEQLRRGQPAPENGAESAVGSCEACGGECTEGARTCLTCHGKRRRMSKAAVKAEAKRIADRLRQPPPQLEPKPEDPRVLREQERDDSGLPVSGVAALPDVQRGPTIYCEGDWLD